MLNTVANPTIYRHEYTPAPVLIDRTNMRIDIRDDHTIVSTDLHYRLNDNISDIQLHGEALEIVSLAIDSTALAASEYDYTDQILTIPNAPKTGILHSEVKIYPNDNKALEGLYRSGGMLTTQCEAEGFRRITFFSDRPDVLSLFDVRIEADANEYPILLSNGNCMDKGVISEGRHFAQWQDPIPKPAYLFAMVAGQLSVAEDTFVTQSGRTIDLAVYTEPHNEDKTSFALDALKRSMRWDETRFNLEYDLDVFMIVAVDHFNMGAMENKGLNIFNTQCVLANPKTATDSEYRRIESIIGHEYFHNWTGNRVTCRSWFELSLKEGLTVFRDQEFSADMGARDIQRIEDVSQLQSVQFPEDSGPMAHPVRPDAYKEINNFYTPTVYEKGAEVVRLLHTRLGETGFQKGMQLYFERHDGQAVTCDDFVAAMADANQFDLSAYLGWYSQSGTPILTAKTQYDADAKTYQISLSQHTPETADQTDKQPLPIPVNFALLAADSGEQLSFELDGNTSSEAQLMLDTESKTWTLQNVDLQPVFSPLRGFSAPVKLDYEQSKAELCLLMAHEKDAYSRWAAAQKLMVESILSAHESASETPLDETTLGAFSTLLEHATEAPELAAKLLDIPTYAYLIDQLQSVKIDDLVAARRGVFAQLAEKLAEQCERLYQAMQSQDQGRYEDAPLRTLKNATLRYWAIHTEAGFTQAKQQLAQADNMTDELGGVQALILSQQIHPSAEKDQQITQVLADFYDRWSTDGQVIEKWLGLTAATFNPQNGIQQLDQLMAHKDFDVTNPNRIRAVIGGFIRNTEVFHQASGEGYRKLASIIQQLDKQNPQIAAALCRAFTIWGKLDSDRQDIIKQQLTELRDNVSSSNVIEWIEKLLDS